MYLMFGVSVDDEKSTRIAPLTNEVFSPDISVLNQKLIRAIYPNATFNFLTELFQNNSISELKMYPSMYINNGSVPTDIDPLLHFLEESNQISNVKYKPSSDLFGDDISNILNNIMSTGLKLLKKNNQLAENFTSRTVKLKSTDSSKIIVCQLGLKLMISTSMYTALFNDDDDDSTLMDLILQNMVYFKTADLSRYKLAYRLKLGVLDVADHSFRTIATYKPIELDLNLSRRQDSRLLQVPIDSFLINVFDLGATALNTKLAQQVLVNRKQAKVKQI